MIVDLLIYQKIFALGFYNEFANTLHVTDASNLELLPYRTQPVPITEPTLSPSPTVEPVNVPQETTSSASSNQ